MMQPYGGFDHNVQTFRIVTDLEKRYPDFDGLNLTWETLEGVVKHNGPITDRLDRPAYKAIEAYTLRHDLALGTFPSAEAQVAALADDIAYNNHDVDDGLQAGLFGLDEVVEVPLIGPITEAVRRDLPQLDDRMIRLEAVRRMIGAMVGDVMAETRRRAAETGVQTADDVRGLGKPLVASPTTGGGPVALRAFLQSRMYRHFKVNRTRSVARRTWPRCSGCSGRARRVCRRLARRDRQPRRAARARVVCDYIAGMTDRFAIDEHRRLFHMDVGH